MRESALSSPAAATSTLLVEARGIARTFRLGDAVIQAVASATCRIAPGDRIALFGPSGSGKSTLLMLLGGLDEPTSGSVAWPALGPRETLRPANVAFVFQQTNLLAPLTALENVELPRVLLKASAEAARDDAQQVLMRLGLDALSTRLPDDLSGGQAQRVAVARALASRPRLILADEPTGQLDHVTAAALLDGLLGALDGSQALVIATHDSTIAQRMTTRWTMDHGVLNVADA